MSGPDAVAHLQSMVSNDVEAIPSGGGAYALLLTPKARVISDLEVFNTPAGLVLACPPETRDDVVDVLVRARFRKKVELEAAAGAVVWGEADGALATMETPIGPYRLVERAPAENGAGDWEVARIEAGIPGSAGSSGPTRCPPRPASSSGPSASPRAAIPARSRSRGCTTAGTPTAACAAWRSRATRPSRARRSPPRGGRSAASTSIADSPSFGRIGLAVIRREIADRQKVDAGGQAAVVRPLPFA